MREELLKMTKIDAIRKFGFSPERQVITVIGGSQGSRTINCIISASLDYLTNILKTQIIWQTGTIHYKALRHFESTYPSIRLFPFLEEIGPAYSAADLVISRAGALTLAEIAWCAKPSLLIPFPGASADHQTRNANSMKRAEAAVVLLEKDLSRERFIQEVEDLISNRHKLSQMSKATESLSYSNSAEQIVNQVISQING